MAEVRKFKKDYYARLMEIVNASEISDKSELVDFINHELDLLSTKSSKKTPTKTQKENVVISEKICTALAAIGKPVTISELMEENAEMGEYSNQKLSALLRQLVESGKVEKTVIKKRSYFAVAAKEE